MIPKPIWYTVHARRRMRERHITRRQVRFLIARGDRQPLSTGSHGTVWEARAYLGRREASVVVAEDARRYLVITAYWTEE
jgi:hypothetical protein